MPVRLVCPSCSASLSVKDEYAGRAVKCPKCGGVIPAGQPAAAPPPSKPSAALPPPPPAEPERPLFEEVVDEPPAPPVPKIKGRPSGKPAARANADDDAPPSKRRSRDDDEDDRPARSRRPRDEDDADGDRPRGKKKSKAPLILGIVGFLLLTCCGGVGFGIYWFITKAKEVVKKVQDDLGKADIRVNRASYDNLKVGTTRAEAEQALGTGKTATAADVSAVIPAFADVLPQWKELAAKGRVLVWRNGDDYLIAAFYPDADGKARLQSKAWRPKNSATQTEGQLDDAKFVKEHPAGGGPAVPVASVALAEAYRDDKAGADAKYKGKTLTVEGKVESIGLVLAGPEFKVRLEGAQKNAKGIFDVQVTVVNGEVNKVLALSKGQTVKLTGRCEGLVVFYASILNATLDSVGPDPNPTLTAAALAAECAEDDKAANEKYRKKFLTITDAYVEKVNGDKLFVSGEKGGSPQIEARMYWELPLDKTGVRVKPGDRITLKGTYQFAEPKKILVEEAWVVPK